MAKATRSPKRKPPSKRSGRAPVKPKAKPKAGRTLPIELDPRRIEESLSALKDKLRLWANKGRYTKVRFKFRGKQLLPDLPLGAVMAAEGLTFYWGGILRALLFNLAGKAVLDVELINDADKEIHAGREALLAGELEAAVAAFRRAVDMDAASASGWLNLGVGLKLSGRADEARSALQKTKELDPQGAIGAEAERLLAGLASA